MKKIFTLLTLMMLMLSLGASAQSRKTWDFTKGVSDETRAAMDADVATWTKTQSDGVTTGWASQVNFTGELTANGQPIKEFEGLQFANFAATNAVNYLVNRLRLQKNCSFDLPALTAGQKITLKAKSANATATDRGFGFVNASIVEGPENGIVLGANADGAPEGGVTTFVLSVQADGIVTVNTGIGGAPASGVEILSIVIDEGDKNIKTWDFTKWSEATINQVLNASDWTTKESASKDYITGSEIRWNADAPVFDANNDLTAGGTAIKEFKGLRHTNLGAYGFGIAFNYQTTLDGNNWGPYNSGSYLWVTGNASVITVPHVVAGSTFKVASETHKLIAAGGSDARGFNVTVNGTAVASTTGTSTSTDYTVFEYIIPGTPGEYVDVELKATKGAHLYSISAEVKDEVVEDKNAILGTPKFDGIPVGKVNPAIAEGFTMTFPKAQNIDPETAITLEGYFGPKLGEGVSMEDGLFDGVESTVGAGISFAFADYCTLEQESEYEFFITKLTVVGNDALSITAKEGEKLFGFTFETSGEPIAEAREWNFTTTAEQAEAIAKSIDNKSGAWVASSKGRYSYGEPITYKPLMIDAETPLAMTDGLFFTMGTANDILIGTPAHTGVGGEANAGGNNGRLQLGGGIPKIIIPQCAEGDEITVTALWSTKNSGIITVVNGVDAANPETNVINMSGSSAPYKIIVSSDGDVILESKNLVYNSISIFPASIGKQEVNYTINATDAEGNAIKKLAEGTGMTNDKVEIYFPYYLKDEQGNLYTNGSRGTPFNTSVTLDEATEYGIQYKQTKADDAMLKAVFCAEAEDIEGTVPSESANLAVRASMGKASYNAEDITLCTLQPGTYAIKALLWDETKNGGVTTATFAAGEAEITVTSTGDNMSEAKSEQFVVAEAQPLVWKAGGESGHCVDAIIVYEIDPNYEPDGVITIAASKSANGVIKTVKGIIVDGKLINYNGAIAK